MSSRPRSRSNLGRVRQAARQRHEAEQALPFDHTAAALAAAAAAPATNGGGGKGGGGAAGTELRRSRDFAAAAPEDEARLASAERYIEKLATEAEGGAGAAGALKEAETAEEREQARDELG